MKNYAGQTAGRAAGQVTAGRGGGGAGCGPSYCGAGCGLFLWQNLRCGLTAGQVTAGRAAGSDFQPAQGLKSPPPPHKTKYCSRSCSRSLKGVTLEM